MRSIPPRLRASVLLLVVVALSLAQNASEMATPEIRRVGDKLACLCRSCNNSVATCQMIGCGYTNPARAKIAKRQAEGASDQQIVAEFVSERGTQALVVPPTEGVFLTAWLMPFVMIAIGLAVIWWFIKRYRRPAAAGAPMIETDALDRYQEQIEKDLAKLD